MASVLSGISGAGLTDPLASSSNSQSSGLDGLSSDEFIKILITQLSQQNPLEPMSNQELLNQISSINDVNVTRKLDQTLTRLISAEGVATASSMIGKKVVANIDGKSVTGVAQKVVVEDADIFVVVNGQKISVNDISEIEG